MKVVFVTILVIAFILNVESQVDQLSPLDYLSIARINVTVLFKEEWVDLCSLHTQISGGRLWPKKEYQECRATLNDAILELKLKKNAEKRCNWSFDTYASDTNLTFLQNISKAYDRASQNAGKNKNFFALDLIETQRKLHLHFISTNKHSAILRATASSGSLFSSGGKCDLTLMGRIKRLDVVTRC